MPPTSETANRTEFIVGRWLKARGNRDQLIIATKVASLFPGMDRTALVANRCGCGNGAVGLGVGGGITGGVDLGLGLGVG